MQPDKFGAIVPPFDKFGGMILNSKGKHTLSSLCGCGSKARSLQVIEAIQLAGMTYEPEDVGRITVFGETLYQTVDGGPLAHPDLRIAGRIATNHIFSDLFAKGLKPLSLTISVEIPPDGSVEDLGILIESVRNQVEMEGATLVNGHTSIAQDWRIHGSATGILESGSKFLPKKGARPGDKLFVTKPLGSGRMLRLLALGIINEKEFSPVAENMLTSNRKIGHYASRLGCSAASDVTGFGLLATLVEMLGDDNGAEIYLSKTPKYSLPSTTADLSCIPAAYLERDNAEFVFNSKTLTGITDTGTLWHLFSPETSGGLIIAANPKFQHDLAEFGCVEFGTVTSKSEIIVNQ